LIEWFGLLVGAAAVAVWSVVVVDAWTRRRRDDAGGTVESWATIRWVIVLAWAFGAIPSLLGLFQLGRQGNGIGTLTVVTGAQARLATVLSTAIAFLCFRLIVTHLRAAPATDIWRLGAFLLPWFVIEVVSGVNAGYLAGRQFLLYPLIGITFWLVSPPLRVVSTLAFLAIGTAAFSLVFALVSPLGLIDAGRAGVDKAILGNGPQLLAGPYNASNGLALSLTFGAASVAVLRSARLRILGFALIGVALLWAAGRTSILATTVLVAVYVVTRGHSFRALQRWTLAAILVGTVLVIWTPLNETNPLAFSQRGVIWITSLSNWHHHLWLGSGPEFYERGNPLGFYALYGHNLVVDTLARGGLVALAGVVVLITVLARQSLKLSRVSAFPPLFVIAFVYASWLEVPIAFNNLGIIQYACWLPLAAIFFTRDQSGYSSEPAAVSQPELQHASTPARY
jgi:hypothetical protein